MKKNKLRFISRGQLGTHVLLGTFITKEELENSNILYLCPNKKAADRIKKELKNVANKKNITISVAGENRSGQHFVHPNWAWLAEMEEIDEDIKELVRFIMNNNGDER